MALREKFSSGLSGPNVWALADALDEILGDSKVALAAYQDVPDLTSESLPTWALGVLGQRLNLARQADWSDTDYLLALRAHAIARRSAGTLPDLYELSEAVTPTASQVNIVGGPSDVQAYLPGVTDLPQTQQQIIGEAFLRAIDAIAGLKLISAPENLAGLIFRLDDPLRGLDRGLLADTIFIAP